MNWDLEGKRIFGYYMNNSQLPVNGVVQSSRVKYGGAILHYVKLDTPLDFHGVTRNFVNMYANELEVVEG